MSKAPSSWLAVICMIGLFWPGYASAKKLKPLSALDRGELEIIADLDLPFTESGAGWLPKLGFDYGFFEHLTGGLDLSYVIDGDGNSCPGNPVLHVRSVWWYMKTKPPYAYFSMSLAMGLGVFNVDGDALTASRVGIISQQSWLRFLSEHLVIRPRLAGGVGLSGGSGFHASLGFPIGLPVHDTDARDTEGAMEYAGHLSIGLFGDWRGHLAVSFGTSGLYRFSGEDKNTTALDLGFNLAFRYKTIRPRILLRVPLAGPKAGIEAILGLGITAGIL